MLLVLLQWWTRFPLYPTPGVGVPVAPSLGFLQCRLSLFLVSLPLWLSLLEMSQLLPERLVRWRPTRLALVLAPGALLLVCLADCRLWNGYLLELLGAMLLLWVRHPLAWMRQFVAMISLVAAFSLAWQGWLGGVALARQLGCTLAVAQFFAWISLGWMSVSAILFTLGHRRGGPALMLGLGTFYSLAPYAGQSLFDPGDASLLLTLGLVGVLHRWAPEDYDGTAHTLMAGVALLVVVGNATFLTSRCLFPIQWLSPPVHLEAVYSVQSGEERFSIQCERHSQRGGRTRIDSFHTTWQKGKQRVLRSYGGLVPIAFQNETVLEPRFWSDCPSSLLQTGWYHQRWQNWARSRFPGWKVGATLRIDEGAL